MQNKRILLPSLLSIVVIFSLTLPALVAGISSTPVSVLDDYAITHPEADSSSPGLPTALNLSQGQVIPMVAAGGYHTVGLMADGSLIAMGLNNSGQCGVGGWAGIIKFAAGGYHTAGLKSDGTVFGVGNNDYGQCNVGNWTGII